METRYLSAGDSEGNKEMVTRKLASFLVFSFFCYHIAVIELLFVDSGVGSIFIGFAEPHRDIIIMMNSVIPGRNKFSKLVR